MSRVSTYPPLVIARNQASVQNLVKSTKLERITIDSKKAQHRIEKKENKEKRKANKREKSHKHSSKKTDDFHHKQEFLSSKKVAEDETEQLEKSGLTEEFEEPLNQLGYLSDGSENSKKRKRDDSPPPVESLIKVAHVDGNPLKIRISFKRPKAEVPAVLPQADLGCSTSDAKSHSHQHVITSFKRPKAEVPVVLPQADLVCSTLDAKSLSHQDVITSSISVPKISEPEVRQPSTHAAAIVETNKIKKHRSSKEDRYNALFDDWTPPSISFADNDGDDWLFGNKRQEMAKPKTAVKIVEDMKMRSGDSSWPRAQYLSEVGIYSLPYTVPF